MLSSNRDGNATGIAVYAPEFWGWRGKRVGSGSNARLASENWSQF